jgi:hypothetical protein
MQRSVIRKVTYLRFGVSKAHCNNLCNKMERFSERKNLVTLPNYVGRKARCGLKIVLTPFCILRD